jgi:glycosyltransferase involved in cell wall biosynthesis
MSKARRETLKLVSVTISNNSSTIEQAITSVAPHVDEVVLIDTGITDDTKERVVVAAEATPVRVVKYQWIEDFADARNFALRMAKTSDAQWALIVDSDEWLTFPNGIDLKARLREVQQTSDRVVHVPDEIRSYHKIRFIRVPATKAFVGRTHEVYPGTGPRWEDVTFGEHVKTSEQFQRKFERDERILMEETAAAPADQRWWYYLGDTRKNLKKIDSALAAYIKAGQCDGWDQEGAWAWYQAAWIYGEKKDSARALWACQEGLRRHPGIAELAWTAAHFCYWLGRYHHAVSYASAAVALGMHAGCAGALDRTGFQWAPALWEKPYEVLMYAYEKMGQPALAAEAAELFHQAIAARETHQPKFQPATTTTKVSMSDAILRSVAENAQTG